MSIKRNSIIRDMPSEEFRGLVATANSISDILRGLKLTISGNSHKIVKDRIAEEHLDCSHMIEARKLWIKSLREINKTPLELVLVENSTYPNKSLKNN